MSIHQTTAAAKTTHIFIMIEEEKLH